MEEIRYFVNKYNQVIKEIKKDNEIERINLGNIDNVMLKYELMLDLFDKFKKIKEIL